jgi:hypothetical protein
MVLTNIEGFFLLRKNSSIDNQQIMQVIKVCAVSILKKYSLLTANIFISTKNNISNPVRPIIKIDIFFRPERIAKNNKG